MVFNSDTLADILNSSEPDNNDVPINNSTSQIEDLSQNKIDKFINETTSDDLVMETADSLSDKPNKSNKSNRSNRSNKSRALESATSSELFDTNVDKYLNEPTSDEIRSDSNVKSNRSIFMKENSNNNDSEQLTSDIDTNTLLKVIKKIQTNNIVDSNNLVGGNVRNKKQLVIGHRKLISDSDNIHQKVEKKQTKQTKQTNAIISEDYDLLYNTDSELGTKSKSKSKPKFKINELHRMMMTQKDKLHNEVFENIMGMLNNGLLTQSNKPIEANEKNAKLIKGYIYRHISEKNPQMGGMDKILTFKTMSENEIINLVKKMPDLGELEKSILKQIEEKKANKNASKNIKSTDVSETEETSEELKTKKSSKKSSKKK
jgi:hypothetical protein